MGGVIRYFARHRVAPNVLMAVVIMCGLWALDRLNTQFLPDFDLSIVQVTAEWSGASAEDVQESLTIPLEQSLLSNTDIDELRSTSFEGGMNMNMTLRESVQDVRQAVADIESAFATVRLPEGAEEPDVSQFVFFEDVADVLLYGDLSFEELRTWALRAERSLKAAGIARVDVEGLPEADLTLTVPVERLLESGLTVNDLAQRLGGQNLNTPAGITGENVLTTQLRFQNQTVDPRLLSEQRIASNNSNGFSRLGDLGELNREYDDNSTRLFYEGQPAVRLSLSRASGEDTLVVADNLQTWRETFEPGLPEGMSLTVYNENWRFVLSRINIILESGLGGIVLVLLVLFLFLNHRLAFWVALGIPVSFMATLILVELTGNSINLISLLGFLIALGIIVDDAIVVGEDTFAHVEMGEDPKNAAVAAAQRMLPAVLASSVTTIAAFLPLLLVSGQAGTFTKAVPLVVIFAIVASLIECFLILPGHLAHSLKNRGQRKPNILRRGLESGIEWFRQVPFRNAVQFFVSYRLVTYSVALSFLFIAFALVSSGRVKFVFFPDIQQQQVTLEVAFTEGTPVADVQAFLQEMQRGLRDIEDEVNFNFVNTEVLELNRGAPEQGALFIEMDGATDRPVSNSEIVNRWREQMNVPANVLSVRFVQPAQGPSTSGVSARLRGEDLVELKAASNWLQRELRNFGGLREVSDNLPLGSEQLSLTLNADAESLGINAQQLSGQIAALTSGRTVQTIAQEGTDLAIRVTVPEEDVATWFQLQTMPVQVRPGEWLPLSALVTVDFAQAIDRLNRVNGELSAVVSARVAREDLTIGEVNQWLQDDVTERLQNQFDVVLSVEGDQQSQNDFFRDVQFGAILGLLLIFGALAWVFESWLWPLAVLAAIPFGLVGAIGGHWAMGLELSVLSVYGLFGLSGIIINNAIVLITFYRRLRDEGMSVEDAVVEASVQRFRAVLVTSLTTIAGLSFLLFETSFDAQFLIPVAAGIVFGLGFGTVIILFLVPALLTSLERMNQRLVRLKARFTQSSTPELAG
ncbi:efflux RND transporter permease subunit [Salinispirillum marinum]|uniref:Efflux RND transporter permease subunit n=2 Tax=Saccharospirillaceae TaxID=255527 RepID=A0ABV8BHP5_9GAMM